MPVVITGLDDLLDDLDIKTQRKIILRSNEELVKRTKTAAQKYPPPKSYVRTYKLQRGWNIGRVTYGSAEITNAVEYAPFVQDEQRQAWMHKNHWDTDKKIGLKQAEDYPDILKKEFRLVTGEHLR